MVYKNLTKRLESDTQSGQKKRAAGEIFSRDIEPDARFLVHRDLESSIKAKMNVCLIDAPGGLRTGLVNAIADDLEIMLLVIDGAKAINSKEFVIELVCSLKEPLKAFLKQNLLQINEEAVGPENFCFQAEKANQNIARIENFLAEFNESATLENCWSYYVQAVDLFLKVSADLSNSSVLVIERIRELRKWQKPLNSEGKNWNSTKDDGPEKRFYETHLRDKISEDPKMSYVILDVSPDASIDMRTRSKLPEEHCKTIRLNSLSKESIRAWIHEFLEKEHNFEIQDSFECLNVIDSAFDGHTGHIHSLLNILLKRKSSNEVCLCQDSRNLKEAPKEKTVIGDQDIKDAIQELKSWAAPTIEATLNTLTTANQRRLLEALAMEKTSSVYSQDFMYRYQLSSRSTIAASLKTLQSQGLISKNKKGEFTISVPLLADWIRNPVDPMGIRNRAIDAKAYKDDQELQDMCTKVNNLKIAKSCEPFSTNQA